MVRQRGCGLGVLSGVVTLFAWACMGAAEIRHADLEVARSLSERDWLQLKLEVLGQRLTFPAYRIQLRLDPDRRIAFEFLASSGLAEHLRKDGQSKDARAILTYHANGIRQQVEELLKAEFPTLWARFDAQHDFRGEFLGPGTAWDSPPTALGTWRDNKLEWTP